MKSRVRGLLAQEDFGATLSLMRQLAYHSLNLGVGGWSTKRVLVVDDSRVVRKFVARMLERAGYSVDFAADGHKALTLMKKQFYDCVFMDLDMPVMTGGACAEALRNWEATIERSRPQRTCALSSHADEKEQAARNSGIDRYQSKPVPATALVRTVLELRLTDFAHN
eukprot:FR735310.1.p1 GENE.FR735310.1~~FR735310.1.p1  ORF type:complete len:196 (+),score=25.62 FR735310.1:90-590(+)